MAMLNPVDNTTWEALKRLLDDESPVVREQLASWFNAHREEALPYLQTWVRESDRRVAGNASLHLRSLLQENPVADFSEFIQSQRYELESGIILLNRTVLPTVTVEFCSGELDQLAARCRHLLVSTHAPREMCKVVSRVLFHEEGFRCNTEDWNNPMNSLLSEVLAGRKGLPLSLSVLYILVAERLGLELEPVCMPGRFMVGCFLEPIPFYVDASERGTFCTPEALFRIISEQQVQPDPMHIAPSSVREVLERCCRNLVHQCLAFGDIAGSQLFARYVHEFETTYRRETNF